ncbi:MAG TPA: type I-E CRISPR-associated protein Cse1/CasA [Gammaproteobacteria bacterium]|nr:type I-E CRISPR-associated protein Cse1/CasA [Gammaproteobacteria bacterium]
MNLIDDPWLPFRYRDGTLAYGKPAALADPGIVDLALPRADFQGAAWQWLIALIQTTMAPADYRAWLHGRIEPPDATALDAQFARARHAFELSGDGPCFMQEYDGLADGRSSPVASLLIEAPGAQTLKFNADHFIKRGIGEVMSPATAAIALYTMQINAPSGGKGYRTGLRGGGPLTTLVLPHDPSASLWHKLWLNILPRSTWSYPAPNLDDWRVFPWLASTRTSERPGSETTADDVHPLHMYWAMPRRYRLEVEDAPCVCAVSGAPSETSVRGVRTTNYGYNYDGAWRHPLTPYRLDPKKPDQPPLSTKGQQGGVGYRHWEALVLEEHEHHGYLPAPVVTDYTTKAEALADIDPQSRYANLWAFGYDMDNMKARCWYATQMPLVAVRPAYQDRLLEWVETLTTSAGRAAWQLRTAVKAAWFSRPKDAKGDFAFIDLRFHEATEADFYGCLHSLFEQLDSAPGGLMPADVADRWRKAVRRVAEATFDDLALSGDAEALDMKRITAARNQLHRWLAGGKEMRPLHRLAEEEVA